MDRVVRLATLAAALSLVACVATTPKPPVWFAVNLDEVPTSYTTTTFEPVEGRPRVRYTEPSDDISKSVVTVPESTRAKIQTWHRSRAEDKSAYQEVFLGEDTVIRVTVLLGQKAFTKATVGPDLKLLMEQRGVSEQDKALEASIRLIDGKYYMHAVKDGKRCMVTDRLAGPPAGTAASGPVYRASISVKNCVEQSVAPEALAQMTWYLCENVKLKNWVAAK